MVDLMMNEQQSEAVVKGVPAGFKLTEVGVIPEDWEVVPFFDVVSIVSGQISPICEPYSSMILIAPDHIETGTGRLISKQSAKEQNAISGKYVFHAGDTIYSKIRPYLRKAIYANFDGLCSADMYPLRPKEGVEPKYILPLVLGSRFSKYAESVSVRSGIPKINRSEIADFLFVIPSQKEEQTVIANVLFDTEALIAALEQILAKKQAIKTATMQQLLTGKTRLPQFALREAGAAKGYKKSELGEIPEDWVVTNIGQFTDCCAGGTPSTKVSAYWGGSHPWMSSGELHLKQVHTVADYITDEGLVNSSTKYVPKNSVLVGLAGQGKTRGTVAINRIELCTNQSIAAIFPSEHHSTEFLFYNLDNRYEELRSLSTGDGGRGGLNLTVIRKLHLAFPPKEEQTAIAAILSDMDEDIQTLQQRLNKTRQLKQGMMQELLTGKIRLIERN